MFLCLGSLASLHILPICAKAVGIPVLNKIHNYLLSRTGLFCSWVILGKKITFLAFIFNFFYGVGVKFTYLPYYEEKGLPICLLKAAVIFKFPAGL